VSKGAASEPAFSRPARAAHGLLVLDSGGTVLSARGAWGRLRGVPAADMIGLSLPELLHGQDRDAFLHALRRHVDPDAQSDAGPAEFHSRSDAWLSARLRSRDGAWRRLDWSFSLDPLSGLVHLFATDAARHARRHAAGLQEVAYAAALEERRRMAFELHDGVLQALAGASLRLEAASRLLDAAPEQARAEMANIAQVLHGEQRDLRFQIDDLKEGLPGIPDGTVGDLRQRLLDLAGRLQLIWGIRMELRLDGDGRLPPLLQHGISRIVQEALVNSARHGGATRSDVTITMAGGVVHIAARDNGRGFSFHGYLEDDQLRQQRKGPAVLKHRVWALGGTIGAGSGSDGAILDVTIPVQVS